MTFERVRTIEDLEKLYYSDRGIMFLSEEDLRAPFITKADDPVVSTTTGVYNAIYGAEIWQQLNTEANLFGAIPKVPWGRSGWRVMTSRPASGGAVGVAEAGTLPDSVKPEWQQVFTKPKQVATVFETSEIQEFLASQGEDDAYANMAQLRQVMGTLHKEALNIQLGTDVNTLADNNFESLDRVISSYSEVSDTGIGLDAGDADIYGIDRDASASWADANVYHNSGTDRDLTDELLRTALMNAYQQGANPTMWITGYDTYAKMQGLYETLVRYNVLGKATAKVGVNGLELLNGTTDVGITIATLYGIPIIMSKNVPQDTISRIYLTDTSNPEGNSLPRLSIKIAKPTQYFEAGMDMSTPFAVGKFSNKGMYRTMGEIICTRFNAQTKIRDLK